MTMTVQAAVLFTCALSHCRKEITLNSYLDAIMSSLFPPRRTKSSLTYLMRPTKEKSTTVLWLIFNLLIFKSSSSSPYTSSPAGTPAGGNNHVLQHLRSLPVFQFYSVSQSAQPSSPVSFPTPYAALSHGLDFLIFCFLALLVSIVRMYGAREYRLRKNLIF